MEERIISLDEGRKIKVKKNAAGGIDDAVEEGVENNAEDVENQTAESDETAVNEDEVVLELPEDEEYDEDLVGLTPTQLEKALQEREKAAREAAEERDKLLVSARENLERGDYKTAETEFSQALVYDGDCVEARKGVWICSTENFTKTDSFYEKKTALLISEETEEVKGLIRERVGEKLSAERETLKREEEPLAQRYESAKAERKEAFEDNRAYYRKRFLTVLIIFGVLAVAAGVCALFLYRTTSYAPVILLIAFGALAVIALVVLVFASRSYYVAHSLCRDNDKLSATEDGKRLDYLRKRIDCLNLILDD